MTTVSAWMTLLTAEVLVGGFLVSVRIRQPRMQIVGMLATLALTLLAAWLAWLSTNVA